MKPSFLVTKAYLYSGLHVHPEVGKAVGAWRGASVKNLENNPNHNWVRIIENVAFLSRN